MGRKLLLGLVAFILACIVDVFLYVTHLEATLHNFGLQLINTVGGRARKSEPGVAILDTSHVGQVSNGLGNATVSDRKPVLKAIDDLLKVPGIRGIAVDWDFSPDTRTGGYLSIDDERIIRNLAIKSKKTKIPIVLGVFRQSTGGPEKWLGNSDFSNIAGAISGPRDHPLVGTAKVRGADSLPSLTNRLLARETSVGRDSILALFEETVEYTDNSRRVEIVGEPVDTSWIMPLQNRVYGLDEVDHIHEVLRDKHVILGDARLGVATDPVDVPGYGLVPGVFIHAAATQTKLFGGVRELTLLGGKVMEAIFTFLGIFIATLVSKKVPDRPGQLFNATSGVIVFSIFVLALLTLGLLLWGRMIFPGFISVALGLIIGSRIEAWLHARDHSKAK